LRTKFSINGLHRKMQAVFLGRNFREQKNATCITPNHPALSSIELESSQDLIQPLMMVARMTAKA
jgi:hypothetical protein